MEQRDPAGWWRDTRLFALAFAVAAIGVALAFVSLAASAATPWRIVALLVLLPALLILAVFQHTARQDRIDETRQMRREP